MSYQDEFLTVDLVRNSNAETRGVDAFALALIKAEKQIRKLVTHLVYQFPCFSESHISELREALASNKKVYFKEFINGFDAIYPDSVKVLIGSDYDNLRALIEESIEHRNKIFHGQLTRHNLSRDNLFAYIDGICEWCRCLSESAENKIGYNGFARNSFQKSLRKDISKTYKISLHSIEDYRQFISQNMERKT